MAGLCGLRILLLWAGLTGLVNCQNVSQLTEPSRLPPVTTPSAALPPVTAPSAALPPVTAPSAALPPVTTPNTTLPPVTTPNTTLPPVTAPSAALPPVTISSSARIPESNSNLTNLLPGATSTPDPANTVNKTSSAITTPLSPANTAATPSNQTTNNVTTSATAGQPQSCSYTVTPVKFGFLINITSSIDSDDYEIHLAEDAPASSGEIYKHSETFTNTSHTINNLKPCTMYQHSVTFKGGEKPQFCNTTENKTQTTEINDGDVEQVQCRPEHLCYWSNWHISDSPSINNVPLVNMACENTNKTTAAFCIKPNNADICSNLSTKFISRQCNSTIVQTAFISAGDFLSPREISLTASKGLPAHITWNNKPEKCKSLNIDYACQETSTKENQFKTKQLSELEPYTKYTCVGHVMDNTTAINKTSGSIDLEIDCGVEIHNTMNVPTSNSVRLNWTTFSQECPYNISLFSYQCSCLPHPLKRMSLFLYSIL
ncbi:uncharacterized protein ACJ7VT_002091 [Polymixia lowei]